LHGFWHLEAYRAFKQVIRLDSTAAMAYWGLAMCAPGFGGQEPVWKQAIERALSLQAGATDFEKALIDASAVLVKSGIEAAQTPFRNLYKKYPKEPEAIAFSAIMLRQHENENTQLEVKKLLEEAMVTFPNYTALMHYYIHVMELRPEFSKAKGIAKQLHKLAPNATHLSHMPGHLHYLAGEYSQAVAVYEKARQQEIAYHAKNKIPFVSNQNYIHNLQFLAVAHAENNDYEAALKTAQELATISFKTEIQNLGAEQMLSYEGLILPALVHIRFRKWEAAIGHLTNLANRLDHPVSNPMVKMYIQVMALYSQAMAAVDQDNVALASQKGGELSQLMAAFEQQGGSKQNTDEFKSINETYDIMSMARYELAGWIDNLNSKQAFNDAAWKEAIALQKLIRYDEPPRLMYPIEESMARLYKKRGETQEMKKAIKLALIRRPHSEVIGSIATLGLTLKDHTNDNK
jgi:tetratricopeptide (TPR) repeat protein